MAGISGVAPVAIALLMAARMLATWRARTAAKRSMRAAAGASAAAAAASGVEPSSRRAQGSAPSEIRACTRDASLAAAACVSLRVSMSTASAAVVAG
eukprot:CAMPEP_0179965476 /NCGR_PEP_ID=MMETSP0983-20121128/31922_1 /TAXON_ID=483367 /ORGANISM="non described non described, Strain CCMP 2436" /LENGTH=96 /DNA_ID=CAMNT_0021878351 /DNA_START=309 /DNA_END=595 /DNA_ORIENTATION=-